MLSDNNRTLKVLSWSQICHFSVWGFEKAANHSAKMSSIHRSQQNGTTTLELTTTKTDVDYTSFDPQRSEVISVTMSLAFFFAWYNYLHFSDLKTRCFFSTPNQCTIIFIDTKWQRKQKEEVKMCWKKKENNVKYYREKLTDTSNWFHHKNIYISLKKNKKNKQNAIAWQKNEKGQWSNMSKKSEKLNFNDRLWLQVKICVSATCNTCFPDVIRQSSVHVMLERKVFHSVYLHLSSAAKHRSSMIQSSGGWPLGCSHPKCCEQTDWKKVWTRAELLLVVTQT